MVKEEEGLSLAIVVHKRVENAFLREKLMALFQQIDHDQAGTIININGYYNTTYGSRYRIEMRHAGGWRKTACDVKLS
jgi:hypothetical protein